MEATLTFETAKLLSLGLANILIIENEAAKLRFYDQLIIKQAEWSYMQANDHLNNCRFELMFRIAIATIFTAFLVLSCDAQDEHFSQFYALPIHVNPALTGAYDGTYRMSAVYRDQWNNQLIAPYKTFAAGGDTSIPFKVNRREDKIGVGLFFISDRVSEYQIANNKLNLYSSYHMRLGENTPNYIGVGVQLGVTSRNFNYDNIVFQDQFNQVNEFDQPTSEILPPNNIAAFDLGVGINYYIELPKSKLYVGAAIHHLNKPTYSFYSKLTLPDPNIDISQELASRKVFHISYDKKVNLRTSVQPRIIYQLQGEHNQLDLGTNIEYTFKSNNTGVIFGLWATMVNDLDNYHLENLTPLIGIRQKKFIFGLSYDVHMRDAYDNPFGYETFEFSIRFSGITTNESGFCPTF